MAIKTIKQNFTKLVSFSKQTQTNKTKSTILQLIDYRAKSNFIRDLFYNA